MKTGVFICHCGINISKTVDIEKVKEALKDYPGVSFVTDYKYMCSEPGQDLIKKKIKEEKLDRIVVAACSPTLHENTFRIVTEAAGINPYLCEIANIREQCSWVHEDIEVATPKAIKIIKSIIEKSKGDLPLDPLKIDVNRKALVIGGGISGMQTALNIANSGYEVIIVEKEPSIGGHMAQLSETFPTLDCSQCILTPKMVEVAQNKNIKLMTYSEVAEVSGYVGNFKVKIKRKSAYVDWGKCNGCGLCIEKCPTKVPSEFERGLGERKVIYTPFPQAVPNKVVIDKDNCRYFKDGKCGVCKKLCPLDAVDYEQKEEIVEEEVGAIVVATGLELYPIINIEEYGKGKLNNVIDGLAFERLLSASGPTGGEVRRPSDGKVPQEVVFIQCVGSRDPEKHFSYCSRICCMYTAKHAMLYKHRVPSGQPYVFYIDIRAGGKNYEEFVQRAQEEDGVVYLRGRVAKLYSDKDKIVVCGTDTLASENIEIRADMVVLAMATRPARDIEKLANILHLCPDENGFLTEAHPKLKPVETMARGIYIAGAAQAPKDIPDTVAQASAAASYVMNLFSSEKLEHEPITAGVDEDLCSGCGVCIDLCPYLARELNLKEKKAEVNEILCEGCGSCTAACPTGSAMQKNFTSDQILEMIKAILKK
ncbi:4Fe-4S binding protein [Elusimicrobiota bacterium]